MSLGGRDEIILNVNIYIICIFISKVERMYE